MFDIMHTEMQKGFLDELFTWKQFNPQFGKWKFV